MTELSNIIFKYYTFNENNLSAVKNNSVWFADPRTFNDPFDGQLRFNCEHDEIFLEKTAEFISRETKFDCDTNWLRMQIGYLKESSPTYHDHLAYLTPSYTHTYYDSIAQFNLDASKFTNYLLSVFPPNEGIYSEIRGFLATIETTGIACFSKYGSDPKMWAHYADNHKGFCVKYSIDKKCLPDGIIVQPVTYTEETVADSKVVGAFNKALVIKQFCTKHNVWKHEGEVRIISFLKGAGLKALPITLESICFGHAMPHQQREYIKSVLNLKDDYIHRAAPNRISMRIRWEITGGFSEAYEDNYSVT